ncbi:uncharacterized protein LOC124271755 [Haliotis rubra]|uniref:uncharacterized protein LOC124271755 n=1 Tax=Haliotis rubra TaxID=36100 RepID=UPI001EE5AA0C|nr:uncharacterized protein LOC124271755 [Haliotis rubra]
MSRVEIRGKRGRTVAVLLPDSHKARIDCLNKYRNVCNISKDNKYVFARGGESLIPLRCADVLRKFSIACRAKVTKLLTSTSLRKHMATVSQVLNLKDNELDALASFLGHDIRIHREYYRLREDTIQIAKISKILVELEKGTIQNIAGKSLAEIQMDVDESVDLEVVSDHDGEEPSVPAVTECSKTHSQNAQHLQESVDVEPVTDHGGAQLSAEGASTECGETPNPNEKNHQDLLVGTPGGKKRKQTPRRKWTQEEKAAIERQLGKFNRLKTLPGKLDCEKAKQKEHVLQPRPWRQIKYFVKNHKV